MNCPRAASSQPRAKRLSWSPPTWLRITMRTAMPRPRTKRSRTVRAASNVAGEGRDGVVERIGERWGRGAELYSALREPGKDCGSGSPGMGAPSDVDGRRLPLHGVDLRLLLAAAPALAG